MKPIALFCLSGLLPLLAACGSDEKTTVIHDRPVIVNAPSATVPSGSVEDSCKHGYDNSSHGCY